MSQNWQKYQELFNYLYTLGALPLESEMDHIIWIVQKMQSKPKYQNHPDDCAHPSDAQYIKTIGGAVNCVTTVTACHLCGAHLSEPKTDC